MISVAYTGDLEGNLGQSTASDLGESNDPGSQTILSNMFTMARGLLKNKSFLAYRFIGVTAVQEVVNFLWVVSLV